jgi:hypothetical protein
VKIYRLNIGQPDLPTPQKALDVLKHIDRDAPPAQIAGRSILMCHQGALNAG